MSATTLSGWIVFISSTARGPVVAGVAQLDARALSPEQVRGQHGEAGQRVLLGHATDVRVDAEDLLQQQQARPAAARWQRQVGAERAVAAVHVDPLGGHG
jgi:hypothetical protein